MSEYELRALQAAPLFQPFRVRGLTLANRIVMAPMTRSFCPEGVPNKEVSAYYRRRAEAGTGLITTEGVGIPHPASVGLDGVGNCDVPRLYGARALDGWRRVVEGVHSAGGKIVPQLWHMGVMRVPGTGPYPEAPSSRPSGLWGPQGRLTTCKPAYVERVIEPTEPLSDSDINEIIKAYAKAAANARELGFDGVAIHGAHGYLLDTFLWEETNRRTDRWGGDLARRLHVVVEIVRAIRAAIGDELPIFFRFSQWKQQDFNAQLAASPSELEQILLPLAEAGVDVFDASTPNFDVAAFPDSDLNLAGWARKITGKPSVTVGRVGLNRATPEESGDFARLMHRFNRHEFDLVGVGRAMLQDPNWTGKARRGLPFDRFEDASRQTLW